MAIALTIGIHTNAMENDFEVRSVAILATTLYAQRTIQAKKHLLNDSTEYESEQPSNPELFLDASQSPPTLHIKCLYLSYKDIEQYAKTFHDQKFSLAEYLIAQIPYRMQRASLLPKDEYALWPSMLNEYELLTLNTYIFRRTTLMREYLWPEECIGEYDRHLLHEDKLMLKKLEENTIALGQPVIRQWAQEDHKAPIKRCFELLCISKYAGIDSPCAIK